MEDGRMLARCPKVSFALLLDHPIAVAFRGFHDSDIYIVAPAKQLVAYCVFHEV